ncbi:hypothetical protein [Erwinia phyllosphaerae]|uniref:hypothetical protein n=1 Tax=Erwinia phyllosphaerae TaxID=2853256 RepID=UPI001FEE833F|nr:hypothetical protein [Erwinia phyllosphaerae]MBV4365909.1 hypothetical protein [Erwinia phyllosphaerae]
MAITACQILHANDYGGMNQQLTSAMSDGWKPMGYLRITNGSPQDFYQMMYQGNDTDVDSYQAIIANAQTIPVKNSSGTVSATGTAAIAQSVLNSVSLPATTAIVTNTQALSIPVTAGILVAIGTATRTLTLTVSGGVVTAAAIS